MKFGAPWCGPCRMVDKVLDQVKEEYPEVDITKVDVDENPELAKYNQISSIPVIVIYDEHGAVVERFTGLISADRIIDILV